MKVQNGRRSEAEHFESVFSPALPLAGTLEANTNFCQAQSQLQFNRTKSALIQTFTLPPRESSVEAI